MKFAKSTLITCTTAIALTISGHALAAEKKPAGSGPNPFSQCGIGAALFPKTPVGAVISNIIWDIGTTAVTSATASPETCSGKEVEAAAFILETYDSLAEETARGEGTHLSALLNILEVQQENRAAVASEIRSSMAEIVADKNYQHKTSTEKASLYYSAVVEALNNKAA